jgi:hypothetical protein
MMGPIKGRAAAAAERGEAKGKYGERQQMEEWRNF